MNIKWKKQIDFRIVSAPVKIAFECPHCGGYIEIPWCDVDEPESWSDTDGSAERFVRSIIQRGHESVLEHVSISVRFIVDRGVSHEMVRHRLASFSQESTRYCNYSKDGFGGEITVIEPCFAVEYGYSRWKSSREEAERSYFMPLDYGWTPQEARSVLPNSLKTEVVMTANLQEWRTILRLRTSPAAHPQMREVMCPLLEELKRRVPVVFDDIGGESHA